MKKIILIFVIVLSYVSYSQSLSIFDIDTTNFPIIKAKFFAFDKDGNQITNLSPSDLELKENGQPRIVTNVSCPAPKPPQALSSVLVMDVSWSMRDGPPRIKSAKVAANAWVDGLPLGQSECALISFSDNCFILSDFTSNRQTLKNSIENLAPSDGTNYNQALIDLPCGGLQIAKTGKHKRVLIFLTDGQPNFEPKTSEIIQFAKANNITIYAVTLDMLAPQSIKDMTIQTGGLCFENITTIIEAQNTYQKLLKVAQGGEPCEITWESGVNCVAGFAGVELKITSFGITAKTSYQRPNTSVSKLEFNPATVKFPNPVVGVKVEQKVIVTARNANFNVSNITSNNAGFDINPKSFVLNNGNSIELTVSYFPVDSGYNYCKFEIENNNCQKYYYVSGGYYGVPPTKKTLEITKPIAGDLFVVGSDTIITWEGIAYTDTVSLEYSIDNGTNWKLITNTASGLKYYWTNIPKPATTNCKIRARQGTNNKGSEKPETLQFDLRRAFIGSFEKIIWSPDGSRFASVGGHEIIIWDAITVQKLYILTGHTDKITNFCWSPDGSRIASASYDNTGIIWDAINGTKLHTLNDQLKGSGKIVWSPDGSRVATASSDGVGIIWDANTGKSLTSLYHNFDNFVLNIIWCPDGSKVATSARVGKGNIAESIIWDANIGTKIQTFSGYCFDWTPDGSKIVGIDEKGNGIVRDANSGAKIHTLSGHSSMIILISLSPDGTKVATSINDSTSIIYNTITGAELYTLKGFTRRVNCFSWSPDGSKLATSNGVITWDIWDANNGARIHTISGNINSVNHISWSPDGNRVATSTSFDQMGIIWDANTGTKLYLLTGHMDFVHDISWSPDGNRVASSSRDGTGIIWDANNGTSLNILKGHSDDVVTISWSPDGSRIATASEDGKGIIWDANTGTKLYTLNGHLNSLFRISWSPDGNKLATASADQTSIIWDANTGTKLHLLSWDKGFPFYISWSPDGGRVATGNDNIGIIWDANTGTKLNTLTGHNGVIFHICWSPDGSRIATASMDSTSIIWDANIGTKLHTLKGHTNAVYFVSWSPDDSRVVTSSWDNTSIIWDANTGSKLNTLSGHTSATVHNSWSLDGSMIATASSDDTGIIWDSNTGTKLHTLSGHTGNLNIINWSPDSKRVATASADKTAKIWIVNTSSSIIQEDESDVFSIVEPMAKSTNIDMGKCLVGSMKDSLVVDFVQNIGSWKFRVDSIYFSGKDADAFKLVSGIPQYVLNVGENKATEFRFIPKFEGLHSAKIHILTQAETLEYNIIGMGEEQKIQIISDWLDLGKVEIGNENTFIDTVIIKNLTNTPINISNVVQLGPDKEQFEIVSGGGSFTLTKDVPHKMTIKFKPKYGGRTSGQLGFEYNGTGSPATVQLFGMGIGGNAFIANDSAFAGETKNIKLILGKVKPEGLASIAPNFVAKIRFQRTILAPSNNLDWQILNDSIYVTVKGQIGNSLELASIPLIAGLGNVEETAIDIVEIKLLDSFGNEVEYDFDKESGTFKLLGICDEGGKRLINPEKITQLMKISPNPSDGNVNIELNLVEKGTTSLKVFDVNGQFIDYKELSTTGNINIELNTQNYSNGLYFIHLQTPTVSKKEKLIIYK